MKKREEKQERQQSEGQVVLACKKMHSHSYQHQRATLCDQMLPHAPTKLLQSTLATEQLSMLL